MTFKELMNTINLKQALKNSYDIMKMLDDNIVGEEWLNVIDAKLRIHLETLNELDVIYSQGYATAKFNAILDDFLPILIQNLRPINFVASNAFKLGDTTTTVSTTDATTQSRAQSESNSTQSIGYEGDTLQNQDGAFRTDHTSNSGSSTGNATTNSNANVETTTTDRIKFLKYLNEEIRIWSKSFIKEIKNNLLRLIY